MFNLVLNAGNYVRNINVSSRKFSSCGVVRSVSENMYHVKYDDGSTASYHKKTAHKYLEKIGETLNDKLCKAYINIANDVRRTTLKKERRNVITGKTQSEMVKQCGTALGVTQFNTRALGKSTGQAMVKIGEAMMHPNVPVRIMDIDHAITEHGTPRRVANTHFADTIEGIIRKQGLKGLHILNGEELLYLPIVTEETYVNI